MNTSPRKVRRKPRLRWIWWLLSLSCVRAWPETADVEAHLKAAFIYNFARFVEWPSNTTPGPVRIGVFGRGDIIAPLEDIVRGKSANGRPIEVARLASPAQADGCAILLIEQSETKHIRDTVSTLANKPVLTVCDGGDCLRDGGMISFQTVNESVRFQINQQAAENAGLRISSQLLKVALPLAARRQ